MDTLSVVGSVYTTAAGLLLPQVKCCVCGILIDSNPSNMCVKCIQTHVNITEGMLNEYILTYCPECERWLQPPKYWSRAALDSRELMTICLKKIRGLGRFNLVDARFIWTEPHSKRLKLLLTLQKELFANAVVQQSMQIEYIVQWRQCELCAKVATGQPQWDAVVQLRQKAEHKRTFLYLEQLVLKHRMHENTIRIDAHPDGLDFFFGHKSHGNAFVEFINMNAPMQRTDASQLVSHDSKSNTAVQHHTFSIELAPICREDIICLPKKLHAAMGGFGPIVLVHKVYSSIVFVDPQTLRASELESNIYWKNRFNSLANTRRMVVFFVLNVMPTGVVNGKMVQADITVCLESEVGGDREWTVRSHLGAVLKEGDLCKGYLLSAVNHNDENIALYPTEAIPDVVLVHKHYDNQKRRRNKRQWELRQLDISEGTGTGAKRAVAERERDMEDFKDDLERDPEFRKDVQLYRVAPKGATVRNADDVENGAQVLVGAAAAAAAAGKRPDDTQSEAGDEDTVAVDLAELMDDLADMRITGTRHDRDEPEAAAAAKGDDEQDGASA